MVKSTVATPDCLGCSNEKTALGRVRSYSVRPAHVHATPRSREMVLWGGGWGGGVAYPEEASLNRNIPSPQMGKRNLEKDKNLQGRVARFSK